MRIFINAKQIRKRSAVVAALPYELEPIPQTLRDLIAMLVTEGVRGYNTRLQGHGEPNVLSLEQMEDMAQVGKIGFGIPFGSRQADPDQAVQAAIQAFTDGLVRIFVNDRELESLDGPMELRDGDEVTILRLVMLTGGLF